MNFEVVDSKTFSYQYENSLSKREKRAVPNIEQKYEGIDHPAIVWKLDINSKKIRKNIGKMSAIEIIAHAFKKDAIRLGIEGAI